MSQFQNTQSFAQQLDAADLLKDFRQLFYFPQHNGCDTVYFNGNSLGLQPKATATYLQQQMNDWANYAVSGHFKGTQPWMRFHETLTQPLSVIVGAKETEVVAMNTLTVNVHLLMISFYRPTQQRYKIICEAKAFPSDQYALETQVQHHGFRYEDAVIEVAPRPGEHYIHLDDILATIDAHKDELALVLFGGINYYTGQLFPMEAITRAAHAAGAYCGFDLAHAAGNVPLQLHDWGVDFACWCSYKYLNSSPGGISGVFIHEKHVTDASIPRFAGWWGYKKETRFMMDKGFIPIPSAEGWLISNSPVLLLSAHKASLDLFMEAGWDNLQAKRKLLNQYLWFVLGEINQAFEDSPIEIITPNNEAERGCQVSMLMKRKGKQVYDALMEAGVIVDWREPNVIRVAPVPMYNSFEDVWKFGAIVRSIIAA